ncbi:MAG: L-dopachrome tautomerase-related protein, partial [Myxococcota bacterium]
SDAALIVLDLASGKARRLLEGHESVIPDPNLDLVIDGVPVTMKQGDSYLKPKIGVNPIATDADKEWLYFGAMHGTQMYRIKTSALRDPSLGAVELRNQIARFGAKPICDGIAVDSDGNLYLGDLANNAIGVIRSDGSYQELVRDPRLSWVDAFAVGPNQMIYAVTNQLQRSPILNQGTSTAQPPFFVVKFSPIGVR